jgi:RNA polymerase sigma-70 factor (ECF subfamily)
MPAERDEAHDLERGREQDRELMARVAGGDRAARRQLAQQIWHRVYSIARCFSPDPATTEDFAQEALLEVFRTARHYRGEGRLTAWVNAICARTVLREARRLRTRWRFAPLDESSVAHGRDSPEQEALQRIRGRKLDEVLSQIPTEQRMALLLKVSYGHTLEEIAATMDISLQAVRHLLQKGRSTLRTLIVKHPELISLFTEVER